MIVIVTVDIRFGLLHKHFAKGIIP